MANSGGVYVWSRTATTNATADSTVNYAEGQAPSSLNDSARNAMASVAKYRDDIAGAIVTTGTSSAYIVGSYQVFDTLADMSGQVIAFTPHATNAGTCTLNVDSLGAKPLRSASGVEITAGTIIQGTPYTAVYNSSDGAWYLHGLYGNPYSIPIGATVEYWLPTAPNSSFVFTYGQAISRATYATLFASMGTTFGAGDGSTTFNIPDIRGRVTACPDAMGPSGDAGRLTGGNMSGRLNVGGSGGEATHVLTQGEIPSITSTGTATVSVTSTANVLNTTANLVPSNVGAGGNPIEVFPNGTTSSLGLLTSNGSGSISATSSNTGGGSHNNLPPTILCNRIMRII
jgi:microcystin-dependent protein